MPSTYVSGRVTFFDSAALSVAVSSRLSPSSTVVAVAASVTVGRGSARTVTSTLSTAVDVG